MIFFSKAVDDFQTQADRKVSVEDIDGSRPQKKDHEHERKWCTRITKEPITFTYTTAPPPSTAQPTAHTVQFKVHSPFVLILNFILFCISRDNGDSWAMAHASCPLWSLSITRNHSCRLIITYSTKNGNILQLNPSRPKIFEQHLSTIKHSTTEQSRQDSSLHLQQLQTRPIRKCGQELVKTGDSLVFTCASDDDRNLRNQFVRTTFHSLAKPSVYFCDRQSLGRRVSSLFRTARAKHTLVESGIERDWRSLWGKLSGALEPFMADFAEQMGRMVNTFMRQQNMRMKKLHRPDLNPFRLFRSERSPNDTEEVT
ncbi:hypothetical protein TELCIR_02039 [Teladorsagia circumcincta]|uniref:Uncharacterized protein n=1 Tax=Teladorsagia circumcincta TaxID=45464 RepID=A0A2G9V2E8_TELCI|nr:hypothetical protein TELCIR_02039 [Teladorsagia circumcincta]